MTQQQIEVDRSCSEVYKVEIDSMGVDCTCGAGRAPVFYDWGVGQELHGHGHGHGPGHLLLYSSCKVIKS